MYPDPEEFKPERWLDPQYPTYKGPLTAYPTLIKCVHVHQSSFREKRSHPLTYIKSHHQFGYGRRICQGMELVDAELTTACGAIAWGLSLKSKSKAVPEPTSYTSLLITKPLPFDLELKPRSEARAEQIYGAWRKAKKEDPQLVSRYDRASAAWE
jgi:cytochrome P450